MDAIKRMQRELRMREKPLPEPYFDYGPKYIKSVDERLPQEKLTKTRGYMEYVPTPV